MNNLMIKYFGELAEKAITKIADILIPKEKRVKQLEGLGPDGLFVSIPPAENFDFATDKIKAIFNYKTALCRQAIWEIKYRANKKLIRDFGLLLYEYILEELSDLNTFNNFKNVILIPIPASKTRLREKGFNQCVLLCRELVKIDKERNENNFTIWEDFLIKEKDTPHQTKVSNRKKRLQNLTGAFSINVSAGLDFRNNSLRLTRTCPPTKGGRRANRSDSFPEAQSSFILIDDVITTGATMTEAFRALKEVGISPRKIRGFALAH